MNKSKNTIAIGNPSEPGKVQLWCTFTRRKDHISFYVINGAWEGKLYENDGYLTINGSDRTLPAKIVWEGDVPSKFNRSWDYNEVIPWIEEQIR